MRKGVNKVLVLGNLGSDPDVKELPNGGLVANISIATSETWKDKTSGEEKEKTEWHRVVFFNKLAEIAKDYLNKGDRAYIEGRLQTRSWEQDGLIRYSTEIVASEMQMLTSRAEKKAQQYADSLLNEGSSSIKVSSKQLEDVNFDDDIPF